MVQYIIFLSLLSYFEFANKGDHNSKKLSRIFSAQHKLSQFCSLSLGGKKRNGSVHPGRNKPFLPAMDEVTTNGSDEPGKKEKDRN